MRNSKLSSKTVINAVVRMCKLPANYCKATYTRLHKLGQTQATVTPKPLKQQRKVTHTSNTQQALDTLVGKIYQSSEKNRKNRLGNPLGKGLISSGTNHDTVQNQSNAYQLEAWRSGYAIQSVRANMQGLQRLLVDGGILAQLKTQTANQALAEQLTTAIEAFLKLPVPETDPFELISQGKGAALDGYYQRAETIRSLIRTQLAPAMVCNWVSMIMTEINS